MIEIKPCPFCGSDAELSVHDQSTFSWVQCDNCAAEGPTGETDGEAIERWNEASRDA